MSRRTLPVLLLSLLFLCGSAQSDSVKISELFQVIRTGNSSALEKALTDGASANAVLQGYSALMAAALNGTAEEMAILMKHGARLDYMNSDSVTALWLAVPDYDKTTLLLNAGSNPQIPGKGGYTPMVKLACTYGSTALMKLFVEKGAILKKSAPDNYLLYNAVVTDDTAMVGFCIRGGLNINDTTFSGDYPILNLLVDKCFNTLQMLVESGANVNVSATAGLVHNTYTPLMMAALSNDHQAFYYLLDHGADPNKKSSKGMTTLMYAMQAEMDDPEITRTLLEHGANPTDKMDDGTDALYFAEKMGNTESVRLIKSKLKK